MSGETQDWNLLWDTYADSAERNPAQRYRRQLIFDLLGLENQPKAHVLDIGSGQGDFSAQVRRRFPQVKILGLELSASGVQISKRKVSDGEFLQRNLIEPAEVPEPYRQWATHAVCSEVLEHVEAPEVLLKNIRPYLSPHCRLVITVPAGPRSAFDIHIGHQRHFTKASLREVLEKSGYQVETLAAAGFPFMNLYRLTVFARGKKLIEDVSKASQGGMSSVANFVMACFSFLFRFNLRSFPLGWQLVAVVTKKAENS